LGTAGGTDEKVVGVRVLHVSGWSGAVFMERVFEEIGLAGSRMG
jgi:hypothetical protein